MISKGFGESYELLCNLLCYESLLFFILCQFEWAEIYLKWDKAAASIIKSLRNLKIFLLNIQHEYKLFEILEINLYTFSDKISKYALPYQTADSGF